MASQSQAIYREWLKNLHEDEREMGAMSIDALETRGDLDYHYQQFYEDLQQTLFDEDVPNPSLWLGKAEEAINKVKDRITNKYSIPDSQGTEEDGEDEDTEEEFADGTILGFRIVTASYKVTIKALGATRRSRIFPTLADLQEYISSIPRGCIAGIEEYIKDGKIRGFYVWVTDSP